MAPLSDPLSDFRNFLYRVWQHLGLPQPTPVQYDIALYLQHGPKRSIVEAFRGVGKSWVTSAYVCWLLRQNPKLNILVISASKTRADDFTTFTLRLIHELPELQHLIPRPEQRCSKVAFDVALAPASHAPSVKSVGITGQITGSRADVIIADDIEVINNSATQTMRDKLSETVKEFDAVLKPGGRIIYLGTPQTEQSIYNALPERGYIVRIWPARYPGERERTLYGDRLAPMIAERVEADPSLVGKTTDPKRFSDLDLAEREASYGRSGFALQFMLDTRLSDADKYPLKLADLVIMSLDMARAPASLAWSSSPELVLNDLPNVGFNGDKYHRPMFVDKEWMPYTGAVLAIDPSGRGKDETGYAVVKMLHGNLYVTAAGGVLGGYSEQSLALLAQIAAQHKVTQVIIEANFGDGMFTELFKPVLFRHWQCGIEEVKHSTQKERRIIDVLEPVMNQHRLIFDHKVVEQDYRSTEGMTPEEAQRYRLMYQLTRITKDKGALVRDDRLDALAIAVQYWVEMMGKDVKAAADEAKAARLQAELDKFTEGILGSSPRRNSWFSHTVFSG